MHDRLKTTEVAGWRDKRVQANGGRCPLCQGKINFPVADHDHKTGYMRDAICRSCNSGLGSVERAIVRFGIKNVPAFLQGAVRYLQLHQTPQHKELHPTFKSEDEKRERRNKLARTRRAKEKE